MSEWDPELAERARRQALAAQMGGEERVARQHANGRLTVRERIARLLDEGSFREIGGLTGSATYDDGLLSFRRSGRGTRVTVRGRQLFSLPPAWAGVDLDLWPEVRTPLLEEAYRRFFTTTFDNLEACFEGREFRIGRPAPDPREPLLTRSVELLLTAAREWVADRTGPRAPTAGDTAQGPVVDDHGFTHVRGPR